MARYLLQLSECRNVYNVIEISNNLIVETQNVKTIVFFFVDDIIQDLEMKAKS